ncbi:MAG: DUF4038 domain-containing protein [Bacteroides cellulosilyticus]
MALPSSGSEIPVGCFPKGWNRDEAEYYLEQCKQAGFNVVQVQTINGVPAMNFYGQSSMPDGFDFSNINRPGIYGYWDHMDFIIDAAARRGIYIGMVCIWGGLVKSGKMNVEEAKAYGYFSRQPLQRSPQHHLDDWRRYLWKHQNRSLEHACQHH